MCVGGVKVVTCCVWGIIGWDWSAMNLAMWGMSEVGEVQVHVHVAVYHPIQQNVTEPGDSAEASPSSTCCLYAAT